ncbi:MAG: DUF86 domain-containing protein [Candidatus Wallbacteria bacterium]|nr:DUF86 domain-containing protein [Candidatus Wallbacteria bacterium]
MQHIIEAASDIQEFLADVRSIESFIANKLVRSAVVRQIGIIGEAACKLSPDFKAIHSDIPWTIIIGMRNRLIHGYFGVDYPLVYAVCRKEIPDLQNRIMKLLASE